MKALVYGTGVIGSYLVHVLCSAENDVTVLARGTGTDIASRWHSRACPGFPSRRGGRPHIQTDT